jgi:hypothetical protein
MLAGHFYYLPRVCCTRWGTTTTCRGSAAVGRALLLPGEGLLLFAGHCHYLARVCWGWRGTSTTWQGSAAVGWAPLLPGEGLPQ